MLPLVPELLVVFAIGSILAVNITKEACKVYAYTTAGWVCGSRQKDIKGGTYASFLNVPYAKQPLGELRFKELLPPDPWHHLHDSTKVGPICHQIDNVYGPLITNKNMSEACIHANVYVPLASLTEVEGGGLPVFVFIHGGGFIAGSGDPDVYGPEYLMTEDIIVMTFNYRLNVIGYISLNTSSIPGNNALRDIVTFLRWVKDNAKFFGGNASDVTIGGHSAGSANAHLMVLSKAAKGLFKRAILISGLGFHNFFTASPKNADTVAKSFISLLGINSTDPEVISKKLIKTPIDKLMKAVEKFQNERVPITFSPVVEQSFTGVTTVIDEDPEKLVLEDQDRNISLLIGFTNKEEQFFIPLLTDADMISRVTKNPLLMVSPDLVYRVHNNTALNYANLTKERYYMGAPTLEKYGVWFGDIGFRYPAINLAQLKLEKTNSAPAFLYKFSYNLSFSVVKETKNIQYDGAAHLDDLSLIFRANSMRGRPGFEHPTKRDVQMREQMTKIVRNFIYCDDPKCSPRFKKLDNVSEY